VRRRNDHQQLPDHGRHPSRLEVEGLPLKLTAIERSVVKTATPGQRGDDAARAEAEAYGRTVGLPDAQLDGKE
jgi:hypothetical protein